MARPRKVENIEEAVLSENQPVSDTFIEEVGDRLDRLEKMLLPRQQKLTSIHKVEDFNGDVAPEVENDSRLKMGYNDKIASMKNVIKILPPNLIVDGRHVAANIEAICGFKIDEAMLDEAYRDFSHDT